MDAVSMKCDGAARRAVSTGNPDDVLEVLVRVIGLLTDVRVTLEKAGLEVHSTAGPIATGSIQARKVGALAALPFVRRVELSKTLHREA